MLRLERTNLDDSRTILFVHEPRKEGQVRIARVDTTDTHTSSAATFDVHQDQIIDGLISYLSLTKDKGQR